MDRFAVVDVPLAAPGKCRVCGGVSKDWYVDLQYNEEYYGAVYYCCECISHLAKVCGFLVPAEKDILECKLEAAEIEAYNLRVRTDGLEQALDGLRSAGFLVSRDLGDDHSVSLSPVEAGEARESTTGDSLGTGEGEAPEPSDDERVADLHSDGGSEEPIIGFQLQL